MMRILVIDIDGARPEQLFDDERLTNLRRLMQWGCYGRLESVIPTARVPAWMSLATSQDPGSVGPYNFDDRQIDAANGRGAEATLPSPLTVWDQIASSGQRTNIIGAPLKRPPRPVNGIWVGEVLTPDGRQHVFTDPPSVGRTIERIIGQYGAEEGDDRAHDPDWLKEQIYSATDQRFEVVRHFLQHSEWNYFQVVETGLDRLHRRFWKYHDPEHVLYKPDNTCESVIRDYYSFLDQEVGRLFEALDEETIILAVSSYGARRLDGAFCLNQWLVEEGLLVLNTPPERITPFRRLDVNWEKTKVWSQSRAGLFLNVKGREPNGTVDCADYQRLRDDVKARIEAIEDDRGRPLRPTVYKPEDLYQTVRGSPPDLIVQFDTACWQAVTSVGFPTVHLHPGGGMKEAEIGRGMTLDDCSYSRWGAFILTAANNPLVGRIEGARLLDLAPTLLELGGYDVPASMQGASLATGRWPDARSGANLSADEEEAIRQRLSGLGYIS